MNIRLGHFAWVGLTMTLMVVACAPEATPPPVDVAGTVAVQLASAMLTQTAVAHSPIPPLSPSPFPATETPIPTITAVPEATKDQSIHIVRVKDLPDPQPACRLGPDDSYDLISYINTPKDVELLGIGSVPGWYVIKNPYFGSPCWIPADIVEIDSAMDLSNFPVITP